MPSWMLAQLKRETQPYQPAADADRLHLLASAATPERYTAFLCRVWGFEAPIEGAFARTLGLSEVVDLRGRTHIRLLRVDLAALGITRPSEVPCCRTVPTFQIADALGWMYVVEHNALLHGQIRRHLARRLPKQLASAGSYLAGGERALGSRLNELGLVLDGFARTPDVARRIVEAAKVGFGRQRQWFGQIPAAVERRPDQVA